MPILCGLGVLGVSTFHRLQLDMENPEPYTASPLICIEMILILLLLLLLVVQPVRMVYFLVTRRWRDLAILILNVLFGITCLVGALQIDAPTLIYMT